MVDRGYIARSCVTVATRSSAADEMYHGDLAAKDGPISADHVQPLSVQVVRQYRSVLAKRNSWGPLLHMSSYCPASKHR
jgi:hypothetical protein